MGLSKKKTKRRVNRPAIALAVVLLGLIVAGVWYASVRADSDATERTAAQAPKAAVVALPAIDFEDVDPAVVRVVRAAQNEVQANPQSHQAWEKLGMLLLAHGFDDAAAEVLQRTEKLDPNNPRWPYLHSRAIIRLRPADAVPLLKRAAELSGDDELAPQLRLFELYLELDRLDDVEQPLRDFIVAHPTNARAHIAMARLALRRGDLDASEAELELAESERAAEKAVHELRAEIRQRQGKAEEAASERRLAAAATSAGWPDSFASEVGRLQVGLKVMLNQAEKLYVRGQVNESIAVAQATVKQYPDSEWAWILLGRGQIKQRNLDAAEVSLNKALKINPDSTDAQFRLGVVYSLTSRNREAGEAFRKVIAQKPDHPVAHFNLGICYEQEQETELAKKHYRKAIEYQPEYFDPHVKLADLLAREAETQQARELYKQALQIRPSDDYAKTKLAELPDADQDNPGEQK